MDQSQGTMTDLSNRQVYGPNYLAQILIPASTGNLTSVQLVLALTGNQATVGNLVTEVRDAVAGDYGQFTPGSQILSTRSLAPVDGQITIAFGAPAAVTAGQAYALVFHAVGGDNANYYRLGASSSDKYVDGMLDTSSDGGATWGLATP